MKQFKSISGIKDHILEMIIGDDAEMFLTSESNTYVCFDGTATILCEGTLAECFVYFQEFKKYYPYELCIYSREAYDQMMKTINENR